MNAQTQPSIGIQSGSAALEKGHQSSLSKCRMVSLLGTNTGPDQFIQVHDSASEPADTAVPIFTMKVHANESFSIDTPIKLEKGLYVCNSSTASTKTAGAADCWFLTRHI